MKVTKRNALMLAEYKWTLIAAGLVGHDEESEPECSLCEVYLRSPSSSCSGCPIDTAGKTCGLGDSPYTVWQGAANAAVDMGGLPNDRSEESEAAKKAAHKMLQLIRRLRRKEEAQKK